MAETCDIPDALIDVLRDARHICILTGAGVNPNPTTHAAGFDFIIAGNSGLVMPELIELLTL